MLFLKEKNYIKMIQEILAYKKIVDGIKDLLDKSPLKKHFIIEKVGVSSPTFYRKLKTKTFTPDELLSIAKLLFPEENARLKLKEELERKKNLL
jgi:hypothetical protein